MDGNHHSGCRDLPGASVEWEKSLNEVSSQNEAAGSERWQRFWRYPITQIVLYLLTLVAIVLALRYPILVLLKHFHLHTKGHPEIGDIVSELCLAFSAVGAFLVMVKFNEKRSLASAGFAGRGLGPETLLGLLIGGGLFSLVMAITVLFGSFRILSINPHYAWIVPLVLFLAVAVFEETVFRGYLFRILEIRWGSGIALAGSAAVFGLIHLLNPVNGISTAEKLAGPIFIVFEGSILMTAGYLLTRRLWLPIGIHWGWNLFENSIFGVSDSGEPAQPVYTLLHSRLIGPFALTGGPFGPEAGVICFVIGTAAGLLLLRLAIRRGQWQPRPTVLLQSVTLNEGAIS